MVVVLVGVGVVALPLLVLVLVLVFVVVVLPLLHTSYPAVPPDIIASPILLSLSLSLSLQQPVLEVDRPYKCPCACFPCALQEVRDSNTRALYLSWGPSPLGKRTSFVL